MTIKVNFYSFHQVWNQIFIHHSPSSTPSFLYQFFRNTYLLLIATHSLFVFISFTISCWCLGGVQNWAPHANQPSSDIITTWTTAATIGGDITINTTMATISNGSPTASALPNLQPGYVSQSISTGNDGGTSKFLSPTAGGGVNSNTVSLFFEFPGINSWSFVSGSWTRLVHRSFPVYLQYKKLYVIANYSKFKIINFNHMKSFHRFNPRISGFVSTLCPCITFGEIAEILTEGHTRKSIELFRNSHSIFIQKSYIQSEIRNYCLNLEST